ncbi:MAG: hypothetical protein Q8S84_02405 [bacterium]|nr:hypothetical protein [bacterium]MDP3380403.1 hypothetical protein [bacterium]
MFLSIIVCQLSFLNTGFHNIKLFVSIGFVLSQLSIILKNSANFICSWNHVLLSLLSRLFHKLPF